MRPERANRVGRSDRGAGPVGGGGGGGGVPLEPIATSLAFSTTLGAQTFPLPAEAVEGTWVVLFYLTGGTNPIGGPPTGWTTIAETQRAGAYYKQIGAAETATSAFGASNGYPFYGFLVFDTEIAVSQAYAGIAPGVGEQPVNTNPEFGLYEFATKTAVAAGESVYGGRFSGNDVVATPVDPSTKVQEVLTTFGADYSASIHRQDGAGADITMGYNATTASAGISFVLAAA